MNRLRTFFTIFKTEGLLSIRTGDMVLFGLIMPAGIVLLIGFIASNETLVSSFSAISSIGMLASGLMGIPLTISNYRHDKILKRYCVTPVTPVILLTANTLYQALFTICSATIVICIAVFGFGVRIDNFCQFVLSFFFSMFVTFSLGFLIASVSPNIKVTNNLCSIFYFPSLFLSGTTIPYSIMPTGLKIFVNIFPMTHTNLILESAVLGKSVQYAFVRFLILLVLAITFYIVSFKKFKWE